MSINIIGTWRLAKGSATFEDGTPAPPPYGGEKGMGRITLNADGRMMAVLCDGRATLPEGATREYSSYCGNYTFDGKRLVTHVDATSDAGRLSGDQIREVSFEGPYMVFRHTARRADGRRVHREMSWEKIADV
ncbi:MAG: lipocalin-like domain-containing protein [Hyphomicrobiaceae bacterium]